MPKYYSSVDPITSSDTLMTALAHLEDKLARKDALDSQKVIRCQSCGAPKDSVKCSRCGCTTELKVTSVVPDKHTVKSYTTTIPEMSGQYLIRHNLRSSRVAIILDPGGPFQHSIVDDNHIYLTHFSCHPTTVSVFA